MMLNLMPVTYRVRKKINIIFNLSVILFCLLIISFSLINYWQVKAQERIDALKPKEMLIVDLKEKIEEKKEEIIILNDRTLEKERKQVSKNDVNEKFHLEKIMYDVSIEMPYDVISYSIDGDRNIIVINGICENPEVLSRFIIDLEGKKWADDVFIEGIQEEVRENGYGYYPFKIKIIVGDTNG